MDSSDQRTRQHTCHRLENSAKIPIVNFAHGHLPTRRHMHQIKRAAHNKCPACIYLTETDWHILSCPSQSLWRKYHHRTLGETLTIHHIQLDLALILIQGIQGALANPQFQMNPNNREPIFRALVNSQNKIE